MYQDLVLNILILTFTLLYSPSKGCQWSMEAEQGSTNGTIKYRGGTSNKLTVRLSEGQYIIWAFVTESSCMLQVLNVEYTNDGLSDIIALFVDSQNIGSFVTKSQSDHGHLWNEPVSSGPIGKEITLSSGDHTIKSAATKMDKYGIEVDKLTLGLICTNDVSNSDGVCPKSQEPNIIPNDDPWNKGYTIALSLGILTFIIGVLTLATGIHYHRKALSRSKEETPEALSESKENTPLLGDEGKTNKD